MPGFVLNHWVIYIMTLMFVLSTILSLTFVSQFTSSMMPRRQKLQMLSLLEVSFTYIIVSLTNNSLSFISMSYIPFLVLLIYSSPRWTRIGVLSEPLIIVTYFTALGDVDWRHLLTLILIDWLVLSIIVLYRERHKMTLVHCLGISVILAVLEMYQTQFYPGPSMFNLRGIVFNMITYLVFVIIIMHIYDRLKQVNSENMVRTYRDPLTKLYNFRAYQEDYLGNAEERRDYVLVILDIDQFKQVNDTYGHDFGNGMLEELAQAVTEKLAHDFERQTFRVYRFGGEELVAGVQIDHTWPETMEKVKQLFEELQLEMLTTLPAFKEVGLTFSAGISTDQNYHGDPKATFQVADRLLYQAKSAGGQRIYSELAPPR